MTREDVESLLDGDAIFYDGLDSAIIGVAERFGMETVVCYDRNKVIAVLMETFSVSEADLSEDEIAEGITIEDKKLEMAEEWFQYNTIGGWNGDYTPVFVTID